MTVVVVGKRHHTRFYPTSAQNADRSANCTAGTVVDRGVTEARNWDFFLQAVSNFGSYCFPLQLSPVLEVTGRVMFGSLCSLPNDSHTSLIYIYIYIKTQLLTPIVAACGDPGDGAPGALLRHPRRDLPTLRRVAEEGGGRHDGGQRGGYPRAGHAEPLLRVRALDEGRVDLHARVLCGYCLREGQAVSRK